MDEIGGASAPAFGREDGLSPYAAGRAEYERQNADLLRGKARWQQIAFALAIGCAVLAVGNVVLALRGDLVPYVVEVDRHAQIVAYGPADRFVEPDRRMLVSELGRFVRDVRSVYTDPVAQQDRIAEAYNYVTGPARLFLDRYLAEPANNPVLLGRSQTRSVEVTAVLPVPRSDTWKLRWVETSYPLDGDAPVRADWEAYLEVELAPSASADVFAVNPLGIYVRGINWTRISEPRRVRIDEAVARPAVRSAWPDAEGETEP